MALLDDTVVTRISADARQVRPDEVAARAARLLLTLVASLLFAVGWCAAKTVAGVWLAAVWTFAAVRVGWQEARKSRPDRPGR